MNSRSSFPAFLIITTALAMFSMTGCGGRSADQAIADTNPTNLHRLANLYVRFQTTHRWKGPKDEAEFKAFINELPAPTLTRMGVDPAGIEDLFVSENDNAPFKIRYGVPGNARGSNDAVVFEAAGKSGLYRVGFTSMRVEEVEDQERYNGLFSGQIKEPLTVEGPPSGGASNAGGGR